MVDEHSACLQGVPRQALPSDHFQLNRFSGPDDPCYIAVKDQVLQMYARRLAEAQNTGDRESNLLVLKTTL